MRKEVVVVILLFAIACAATAISDVSDRPGFPPGYVGGELAPNGDVIGGHPSEEQMARDRAAAGVSPDKQV